MPASDRIRSVMAITLAALFFALPGLEAAEAPSPQPPMPKSTFSPYLAGKMLVAEPRMRDPRFAKTVIYLVSHDSTGALGLIVNRTLGTGTMAKLLKGLGMDAQGATGDVRLHYGGPVEPSAGFILHSSDYRHPGAAPPSTIVNDEITFTTRLGVIGDIASGSGPKKSMIIFGYAGWGPRQLEGEIDRNDWATAPADMELIFDENPETKWERARVRAGKAL